ncbi:hypothetical protein A5893_09560 [Pedobacter psychrophilus]|uniref:Right handed beta helix domain-containing protein n=1 Tax=Pedobacter psychrophilus TaxID=1826909 RepID=A0A179DFW1_9SPHI|nr:hypothetical protein A5893_09560 [Pedobacter psychrophilus]
MRNTVLFILSLSLSSSAIAKNIYVSVNGNDKNSGESEKSALESLQKAADIAKPGDVVLIGGGSYSNSNTQDNGAVLSVTTSGTPDAWIIFKALPDCKPTINPIGWAGIQISASYIKVEGISIIGQNDGLTLLDALADAKNSIPNPKYNTNGIIVEGRRVKEKPHHVIISNCEIGKCPGGGITILEADYVTVEDCEVYNNAWYMRYAGSGITTLNNWAFDDAPGYHIVIQRNYVWNNKTLVPWERTGKLSDGNGILLDVTDQKRGGATNPNADAVIEEIKSVIEPAKIKVSLRPEWKGRALIANNISAYNGGSGIHTFRTKHVDIINNTTYWNGQTVGYQELFPNNCEDITILNNIIVPRPNGKVTSDSKNTNIKWDYNVYPNKQEVFSGENDLMINPEFVKVDNDLRKADFRLKKGSKIINSGTNDIPVKTDLLNKKRSESKPDRGAFEQ